jgi:hypothetical protein
MGLKEDICFLKVFGCLYFTFFSLLLAVLQEKDSFDSDDDGEDEDCGDGSKEASTLAGQKHKSDTVLEGAAKRSGSGGSPGVNSAPGPGAIGAPHGSNSAPTPGTPITLTPEQLRALQAIANKQYQTNVPGEY